MTEKPQVIEGSPEIRKASGKTTVKPIRILRGKSGRRGFTLLELMVVMLILALLASVAAPQVTKYLRKAKTQTARIQVDALSAALDAFHVDTGRFPTNTEGLNALANPPEATPAWDGPYIKRRDSLIDPWGEAYHYAYPGKHAEFDIYTLGSDHREGGEGDARDVGNW